MAKKFLSLWLLLVAGHLASAQVIKEDVWFRIVPGHSRQPLEIQGGVTGNEDGLPLRQSASTNATGGGNQLFQFQRVRGGYYKIFVQQSRKVLEVKDASLELHALIEQGADHGADNQLFALVKHADGAFQIVGKNSGFGLDVFKDAVIQYQMYGNANQTFRLEPVKTESPAAPANHL
jgi:hypothetical protein